MVFGDLAQTATMLAIAEDRFAIKIKWAASDVSAFEPRSAHAGTDSLDNEVAFELSDGSDDDYEGAAQRAAGVDLLAEADELYIDTLQFIEHFKEVLHRPGDPVRCPDQDHIEASAAGIAHQFVQPGAFGLRPGDPIGILLHDLVTALSSHLAEIMKLGLGMLIQARDPHIKDGTFHLRRPFGFGEYFMT